MIAIICGYRDFNDEKFAFDKLDMIQEMLTSRRGDPITTVVQGGQRGGDKIGKKWADARGIKCVEEKAEWSEYGGKAGPIRNARMLQKYDISLVIAFLSKKSKGTNDMIKKAKHNEIEVEEILV